MEVFYRLNPAKMMRYQPYMIEWLKQKKNDSTENGWVNGVYVGRSIASCFPKGKSYPSEPIDFWGIREPEEDAEPLTDADRFGAFAAMFNKQYESKEQKPESAVSAEKEWC